MPPLTPDRIEREIVIRAPLDRVWALVSEPGWWIGEDPSGQVRSREGAYEVVEDPRHGRFLIEVVAVEPRRRVAYRGARGEAPRPGNSTLLEFFLTETDAGTLLRVVESGFQSLAGDQRGVYEGNVRGWQVLTELLRRRAE